MSSQNDQSSTILEALARKGRSRGIPLEFAGEGTGFRQANTIQTCLERDVGILSEAAGELEKERIGSAPIDTGLT